MSWKNCQNLNYKCKKCVYNENYCLNTLRPCYPDCEICEKYDCEVIFCNKCLTIEKLNATIKEKKGEILHEEIE